MPTVVRTTPDVLLRAARTRLLSTGLPEHLILPTIQDNPIPFGGDQILFLRMRGLNPKEEWVEGAGRIATVVEQPLSVMIFSRLSMDPSQEATEFLTNATYGHYILEARVVDYLQIWTPEDAGQNHLTIQPVRLIPSSWPIPKGDESWGVSMVNFLFKYAYQLNQSRQ